MDAHLRYLERDGVTRDGEKGQVYSADKDFADGPAFLDRGRGDRHQFRFIVSAEEGVELSDLRSTTRDLAADGRSQGFARIRNEEARERRNS